VERGITGGTSPTTFSPDAECTRAQIVTFLYAAAGKPSVSGSSEFVDVANTDWYAKPVIWAKANDITGGTGPNTFGPLNVCTRGQVVTFLYKAYGSSEQPDVTPTVPPMVTLTPTPGPALNAQEIYAKCASAVFYIEIYNRSGQPVSTGSGVFLSSDGLAITNHHVVEDAYSARIMTTDGKYYDVLGYYDAKASIDLALIQIDGKGFDYLESNTDKVVGGQTIFAIGSPKGLSNTITTGIVSNPNRELDGFSFIQFSAPISHGSSGGALINDRGQLIGITSAVHASADAQNINFAMPINKAAQLNVGDVKPFPLGSSAPTDYGASLQFDSAFSVPHNGSEALHITAKEGNYPYPDDVSIYLEIANEAIATAQWSDWYGDSIDLYVHGVKPGTTAATIYLLGRDDCILVSKDVTITVTEAPMGYGASITVPAKVIVEMGKPLELTVQSAQGSYGGGTHLAFEIADATVASAFWVKTPSPQSILSISGIMPGSTSVTIRLLTINDDELASATLTLTVVDSRGQQAFEAMQDWIIANHNGTLDDSLLYSETIYENDSQFECAVAYTPGDDYLDVAVWTVMPESGIYVYVDSYIDLDPNYDTGFAFVSFYMGSMNDPEMIFEGSAEIDKATFNEKSIISFYEYKGNISAMYDTGEMMKYSLLAGLAFADMLFEEHLPQYSVADFGYTNIYN